MLEGKATIDHTRRFAADFPQIPYQLLGCTEWSVSAAGFGTYRIHPDVDQHRQALAYAL
ncbi:MAG: aldo/keto reductase, partial [Caldithrix sp.]|nr:aldo/keto reductase [Caldithrix sp.]